jgi:hypothetical protein
MMMREIWIVTMRDHKSNRPEQHAASDKSSGLLAEVRLLNDDQTTNGVRGSRIGESIRQGP